MSGAKGSPEWIAPLVLDGVVSVPAADAERYRKMGYWIDQTHADLLSESSARFAERPALVSGHRKWTYRELGDRISRAAVGLLSRGLRRGDRVVVHLPNIAEYVVLIGALFEIGAIPVLALAAHRELEIRYFVSFTQARAYITVDRHDGVDLANLAERLKIEEPSLEHVVVIAAGGGGPDLDALMAHEPRTHQQHTLPCDVAFLQLSGGTTGRPKLIPRTHNDYLYSVRESARICRLDEDSVQLVVLPVSHNFTMSSPGILGVLSSGGTVVLAENAAAKTAFELIEKHRVTQVSLVPPIALSWLNSPLRERYDLSSLSVIQIGGAKLPPATARRVQRELGVTLQQVFGMAEGLVTYTRLDDDDETIATTQGRPISPLDEIRVVDDSDQEVPTGTPGHLLTRGPYTIRGYYRAPEHNARSFTANGYYRTGDIVKRDQREYLTVVGRAKDQINRGGEKVAPAEVEELLITHTAVHDVSLVGVPDAVLGERTKALIVRRDGCTDTEFSAVDARRYLREQGLAGYKIPDLIEFVSEFPRTGVGKTSKRDQR